MASTRASRFLLSALLMASLRMRLASSSALMISFSATFLRYRMPAGIPITSATTNAITPVKIMGSIGSGHTSVSIKFRIKSRQPNDPCTREMAPQKAAERSRWARMLGPRLSNRTFILILF